MKPLDIIIYLYNKHESQSVQNIQLLCKKIDLILNSLQISVSFLLHLQVLSEFQCTKKLLSETRGKKELWES